MSNAKYDPNLVTVLWGPFLLTGFEAGEFITATMAQTERYIRKSAFGRSIHTLVTDLGGMVTMRFQADSPSLKILATQYVADQAPGGNVILPLIIKDNNGLDAIASPLARLITIRSLTHNDGDQAPREFQWMCEPLVIFHGGIFAQN